MADPRLKERYKKEIAPELMRQFSEHAKRKVGG